MLVAFFKSHKDKDCECVIVKFVDRIWIDKSGDLFCIRTFIVHVLSASPPLQAIRMLLPFRQIVDLRDISDTCLNSNYLFNSPNFSMGGYKVNWEDVDKSSGSIDYDFFNCEVFTKNLVKSYEHPRASLSTMPLT